MITAIKMPDGDHGYSVRDHLQGTDAALSNLGRINVFVGANNSGKSRFLRTLAIQHRLKFQTKEQSNWLVASQLLRRLRKGVKEICDENGLTQFGGMLEQLETLQSLDWAIEEADQVSALVGFLNDWAPRTNRVLGHDARAKDWSTSHNSTRFDLVRSKLDELVSQLKRESEAIRDPAGSLFRFRRIYFPTLRSLRHIGPNGAVPSDDPLAERTNADYFPDKRTAIDARFSVFTGQTLYHEVKKLLLGNRDDRERIRDFEEFISKEFFESKPVSLIPKLEQDVLDIRIDHEEFPIHKLGDGIQSILILTFPLFRFQNERVLAFIEEPELFVHPGLQRVLLTAFRRFKDHQFFLTTHSNHFLDLTLDSDDISVFSFHKLTSENNGQRQSKFEIENVSCSDRRTLELLGVRNSSVLLSNCTIWVEGITDRRYLAHYLSLYQKHLTETGDAKARPSAFKEDLHYSFVEYSGGNITHWSFLDAIDDPIDADRLCGRLFLVTDLDSEKKLDRHEKLKMALKDRYACLECREIENLLSAEVLSSVVASYEGTSDGLNDVVYESYKLKPLGKFIEAELLKAPRKRKGSYQADSGTITDKSGFCQKAIGEINSWDKVSGPAQALTKRIYQFIADHNQ